MVQSLSEALGDARSVLVLAPGMAEGTDAVCGTLARGDGDGEGPPNVLAVSLTRSAADWLAARRQYVGEDAEIRLVETGGTTDPDASTVESAEDLTGIEIALGEPLATFADADAPVTVCLDSLTVLLQYVDLERAYRFLHELDGRFVEAGARAHYHLDPGAHDEEVLATLSTLVDAAVGVGTDPPGGVDERVTVDGTEVAVSLRRAPETEGILEGND
ncbi:MAG: hypothetical protein ABEI11_04290 [Haloarculaceae archaeon]